MHEYLVESLEGKHNAHNKQLPKLGDYYKYSKSSRYLSMKWHRA